jgi:uncharacterized membrane protein YdjX (TVP38/TMEM64 family)
MVSPAGRRRPLSIVLALGILLLLSYAARFATLDMIKANKDYLLLLVEKHYWLSVICYIALYTTFTACSLPGATVLTVLGGFLFGVLRGAFYTVIGATCGATGAFLITRYIFRSYVQKRYNHRLAYFNQEFTQGGTYYLLALRLTPVIPFFLVNIFAAFTDVHIKTFIITTALGIIPGSLVYAFAGQQLNTVHSLRDIVSPGMLLLLFLLALLALVPVIISYLKKNRYF